jgi:8-oxo-dGTP pyrophosphatase MutT (NUDIX family)
MMSDSDIEWSSASGSFKLRAAGLVVRRNFVLVCRAIVIDGVFLPGGKIQFGESARAAIEREMYEEVGVRFKVDRPPLVIEAVRELNGLIHQEVGFYFRLDWPEDLPLDAVNQVRHAEQSFEWIPVDELRDQGFLPPEIIDLIPGGEVFQHLAFDRRLPAK